MNYPDAAILLNHTEVCRYLGLPVPVALAQWARDTGGNVQQKGDISFTTGGKPYSAMAALLVYDDGSTGIYYIKETIRT